MELRLELLAVRAEVLQLDFPLSQSISASPQAFVPIPQEFFHLLVGGFNFFQGFRQPVVGGFGGDSPAAFDEPVHDADAASEEQAGDGAKDESEKFHFGWDSWVKFEDSAFSATPGEGQSR